jgi:hypothetical protein
VKHQHRHDLAQPNLSQQQTNTTVTAPAARLHAEQKEQQQLAANHHKQVDLLLKMLPINHCIAHTLALPHTMLYI